MVCLPTHPRPLRSAAQEWCSLAISPQSAVQKKAPAKKPASRRNLFANLSLNDGGSSTQPDGLSFDAFASASAIALEQRRAHQRQQEQQRQRQLAEEEERERARLERERERQLARVRAEEEQRWAEEQAEIEVHCGWMDRGESGLGGDGLGWAALG